MGIDVSGVDERTLQQALLAQKNGERISFFTGTATGHPHLQRRISAQQRHDLFAQRTEIRRIAKHLAHLNGKKIEQPGKDVGLVQHLLLQPRQRLATEMDHCPRQPPLERSDGITAKVVVVLEIDCVEKKAELEVDILVKHNSCYFGIHTRTNDRSFSTSSGLAM